MGAPIHAKGTMSRDNTMAPPGGWQKLKPWQVVLSFLWLLLGWVFVVTFFSQQFHFGDETIEFFLGAITGDLAWLPCARRRMQALLFFF